MNAKQYRLKWIDAEMEREAAETAGKFWGKQAAMWQARAEAAEAKLSAAREFVAEANEEFTKAAAEDAAMVEQFNG